MPVAAQPTVYINADAQPREIYIGDPIRYAVTVTVSSDAAQPRLQIPSWGEFELLAASTPTVTLNKDGSNTAAYQFLLTTFSTGTLPIPPADASSVGISIKVKSLLEEKGDEGNIRPLKGLVNFKSYLWLWILLVIIAAGALGYFGWKYYTGRKRTGPVIPAGPPRPPEELAWEEIHALEDADLIAAGQIKEFYFRLSMILRQYLERRYHFSALDRTTSELLLEFRRQSFSSELANLCRAFFDSADLVKFAKFTPLEEEILIDLNHVKQFINLSTPQKPAEPEKVKI